MHPHSIIYNYKKSRLSFLDYLLSQIINIKYRPVARMLAHPVANQEQILHDLIRVGKHTQFGRDHWFSGIHNYEDFKERVPLRNYEELRPYFEKIKEGEADVLWKGRPQF